MKRTGVVLLGVLGIIVVVAFLVFGSYISARNQMVAKNEEVKQTWSQVDVVMQRRADLIPNLVATVQGFASHETTVFSDIANARAALLGAKNPSDKIAANGQLDNALGHLLMISEAYPQLRSNQNFLQLQDELAGTENRSLWSGGDITRRCRTTTRSLGCFRTASGRDRRISSQQCLL